MRYSKGAMVKSRVSHPGRPRVRRENPKSFKKGVERRELTLFLDPERCSRLSEFVNRFDLSEQVVFVQACRYLVAQALHPEAASDSGREDRLGEFEATQAPVPVGREGNQKKTIRLIPGDYGLLCMLAEGANWSHHKAMVIALDRYLTQQEQGSDLAGSTLAFLPPPGEPPKRVVKRMDIKDRHAAPEMILGGERVRQIERLIGKATDSHSNGLGDGVAAINTVIGFIQFAVDNAIKVAEERSRRHEGRRFR